MTPGPLSHWIVLLDIENFSLRHGTVQARLHEELYHVVEFALTRARVDPDRCRVKDRGDGILILIPESDTAPARLLWELMRGLEDALVAHQEKYADNYRMRLRVGLNQGLVASDSGYWAGTAINDLARLVDAAPVRQVLTQASRAHLVLVVSDNIYRSVVQGGYPGIEPAAYVPTEFVTKHGQTLRGWVTVPGYPTPPGLDPEMQGDRQDEARGGQRDGDSVTTLDSHVSGSIIHLPGEITTPVGHTPPGPLHDPDDDWPRETPEP
ncbi:hypothetical protein [Streptomyces torulosus]|uniref:hypothetical protein n=1 Tax=Streptomyces torulosus TaxID=68276 RepID=UPI0006EB480F|nr:hypothetical protein [Streptomyces torulosus]